MQLMRTWQRNKVNVRLKRYSLLTANAVIIGLNCPTSFLQSLMGRHMLSKILLREHWQTMT